MIKIRIVLAFTGLIILVQLLFNEIGFAWGFYGHKKINRMAVFTLPPEMIGFYKNNIEYISEHAVDADKRRYAVEKEAPRHFIDIDNYGSNPFDSIPKSWGDAVNKFSEDSLYAHGIVPWHVNLMLHNLTEAFKEKNEEKILKISADIGHYIADAHVPLHTTRNYNGQLTNQKGIHGFWESRIPELKGDDYNYFVGKAKYIDRPLDKIWSIVKASYEAKDSVLNFEAELTKKIAPDKKYAIEERGQKMIRVYSKEFAAEYENMLNGMVERRMRESIITVSSFWYTAWVNAGQPDLNKFNNIIQNIGADTLIQQIKSSTIQLQGHEDE